MFHGIDENHVDVLITKGITSLLNEYPVTLPEKLEV